MSAKPPEKSAARKLQADTDWSYSECLRIVRLAFEGKVSVDEALKREGRSRKKS